MFDVVLQGLQQVFVPLNFILLFGGVFLGITFGALPGLTATMGLALLVPFTFTMSPETGLIMLAGIYVGAMYGDAIPAILINTPGTPSAIATTFDGFPLAQKGMAQHALVTAALASTVGSLLANVVLVVAGPPLAAASLKFGPPEYFWLGIFGLTIISALSSGSVIKGFLAGCIGMVLSVVGMASIGGDVRLTFGFPVLQGGIDLIVALIGFFCLPEILSSVIGKRQKTYTDKAVEPKLGVIGEVALQVIKKPVLLIRSAIIGTIVGFAPGAGGNIASMVSYNEARRWSKDPDKYGKGTIDGVAASESANSAMAPGSLIPLLTLGIPGSPAAAVILGALMVHRLKPGAELFTGPEAPIIYSFLMGLLVAAFLVSFIGAFGSVIFSRIINIPSRYLAPGIIFMTVLGAYAIRNSMLDVWIMFVFGIIGFISRKLNFHPAPIVLGLILGPFIEEGLVKSVLAGQFQGVFNYMVFRPISGFLIALCVLSLCWPLIASWRAKKNKGEVA
ncbi:MULTISPECIES: tripartite tricarboxylate transporter permease [Desulfosediminicola]|uniref:tripartite tricarboxylate transporter permease n=1 Tax=Desulfosediminicola TaxID=2886823 RepID=UPI00142EFBF9|nr:tripartite tricarboxylate transporter permease [Desulfosediminicola ganghwensis]